MTAYEKMLRATRRSVHAKLGMPARPDAQPMHDEGRRAVEDLDRTDIEILRILQTDARLSNEEIGAGVHKSASAVSRRIAELKEQGYILSFQAVLDRRKLGLNHRVSTLVTLDNHCPGTVDAFEQAIRSDFPNVIQWSRLQGSWDYLLVFVARDEDHYMRLHRDLTTLPNVHRTRGHSPMYVSLQGPLPLPEA
jgi:Lrp/AsnC family transcriptional regulator, leucine-responsive regulatory protein